MKSSKSRPHRARKSNNRVTRKRQLRRAEALETRAMLAGDLFSVWHNSEMPADVNGDGEVSRIDIDILAGQFQNTRSGAMGAARFAGNLEGEQPVYLDVNNDGRFDSLDLWTTANQLRLEGEPASNDFQATFEFQIRNAAGDVIATNGQTANLQLGDSFTLEVLIRDSSSAGASGFTQAFVDIGFESDLVTVTDPVNDVGHGTQLSNVPTGFASNVIPYGTEYADLQEEDKLISMGGFTSATSVGANGQFFTLVTIDFVAAAEGSFDFTTLFQDYPFNAVSDDGLIVAFNDVDNNGDQADGENFVATYISDAGTTGDSFDIVNFFGGMVSVTITSNIPEAVNDIYEVAEDFDVSATPPGAPPVVEIEGEFYAVLDVLANDLDGNGVAPITPRNQFSIASIDTTFGGRIEIVNTSDIAELSSIVGLSNQVLLYQVTENFSSPPTETFTYTLLDSTFGESATGSVTITVLPVDDAPLAGDATISVPQGEELTFNVLTLASLQGGASENETLTFVEFIGTDNLEGNFVPNPANNGEFTYTPSLTGGVETFQYVVSDGGTQTAIGEITLVSNSDQYQTTIEFVITDANGNELAVNGGTADLELGDTFRLQVYVQDTSNLGFISGFTQAFVDVGFDSGLVTIDDPATAVDHGSNFPVVPDGSFPTNVIPYGNRYQDFQQTDVLLWMGGTVPVQAVGTNGERVLLVDIEFRASAIGSFDFTTLRSDYPYNGVPNDDLIVAFNNVDNEGNVTQGENLVATYLYDFGTNDDSFDVINFIDGMVSVNITFEPGPGANFDAYEIGEDFDPSAGNENPAIPTPPVVTIGGVQYAVLDVLANDLDENGNGIGPPRSQLTIDSVSSNLGGRVTIQRNAQSIPELAAIVGLSQEVLLYQVPDNVSSPPNETFSYTMSDSVSGNSDTADVVITINPVDDAPLAGDITLTLEEGETITFDAMSLASLQGGPSENETLTFVGFVGAGNLEGTFVADPSNNGQFTYTAPQDGQIETLQYVVSDGGTQTATGTITLRTLLNSAIRGVVYFDANNNGQADDNLENNASPEMRIGGVTVELLDENGDVLESVVTDANGAYRFNGFDAGTYSIRIDDPAFTRKGLTTASGTVIVGNTVHGIEIGNGAPGEALVDFGYRGRDYAYIGRNDVLASNTEHSLLLAFSKDGGVATLEWYSVDEGWDRLVQIRPIYAFMDPVTKNAQIAFEVTVEGQTDPQFVVQAFSTSTPGYAVVGETNEGVIVRVNGAASTVLQNLDDVDAYFANL